MHTDELEWELGQDRMASENRHESGGRMLRNLILQGTSKKTLRAFREYGVKKLRFPACSR